MAEIWSTRAVIFFEDCRFHPDSEQLWCGDQLCPLRPKTLALLKLLLQRPGLALSKGEIMARLWPGAAVTDAVLTVCVNELRAALGDEARRPRYIETLHGRGYRFAAAVGAEPPAVRAVPVQDAAPLTDRFVGRGGALDRLFPQLDGALRGGTRLCLVSGEAGIGKTTLLREFAGRVRRTGSADVALGHCVASFGTGEPYLPLLEALQTLCRNWRGPRVRELLQQHAPMWMLQMPGLLSEQEHNALLARIAGASSQRMLRELADALHVISSERALVLICEDLHDSDPSTIAALSYLMRRSDDGRLLIAASYRPSASLAMRTLVAELRARGACESIALDPFTLPDVSLYLATQLSGKRVAPEFARDLHRRSAGNPLFMVAIFEHVQRRGLLHVHDGVLRLQSDLTELGVPEQLQPLIELLLDRLSPEQREVLEAASICGQELSVAGAAACLGVEPSRVEPILIGLAAESSLVRMLGAMRWPDGTLSQRVEFRHPLERGVVYQHVKPSRRRRMHIRFARRLQLAFASAPAGIEAELALHFELGDRPGRAAELVADAAANALLRSAHAEALAYTQRGLSLLAQAPSFARREQVELRLRLSEGAAWLVLRGFGSAEAEQAYRRAHQLSASAGERSTFAPTLVGLWHFALTRARYDQAQQIADEIACLARAHPDDPVLSMQADNTTKQTRLFRGEPAAVLETTEGQLALHDLSQHGHLSSVYGADPGVLCHSYMAFGSFLLGRTYSGRKHLAAAQRIADALDLPFAQAQLLFARSVIAQVRGDLVALRRHALALVRLSEQHDFYQALSFGQLFMGFCQVSAGDIDAGMAAIEACLRERERLGLALMMPHALSLLARAQALAGLLGQAVATIERARQLALDTDEGWYLAELHRYEAELKHAAGRPSVEVVACLRRAGQTARAQHARPFLKRTERSWVCLASGTSPHSEFLETSDDASWSERTTDPASARVRVEELEHSHDPPHLRGLRE